MVALSEPGHELASTSSDESARSAHRPRSCPSTSAICGIQLRGDVFPNFPMPRSDVVGW
jgi:hypothetical protein